MKRMIVTLILFSFLPIYIFAFEDSILISLIPDTSNKDISVSTFNYCVSRLPYGYQTTESIFRFPEYISQTMKAKNVSICMKKILRKPKEHSKSISEPDRYTGESILKFIGVTNHAFDEFSLITILIHVRNQLNSMDNEAVSFKLYYCPDISVLNIVDKVCFGYSAVGLGGRSEIRDLMKEENSIRPYLICSYDLLNFIKSSNGIPFEKAYINDSQGIMREVSVRKELQ